MAKRRRWGGQLVQLAEPELARKAGGDGVRPNEGVFVECDEFAGN